MITCSAVQSKWFVNKNRSSQPVRQELLQSLVIEVELQMPATVALLQLVVESVLHKLGQQPTGDLVAQTALGKDEPRLG